MRIKSIESRDGSGQDDARLSMNRRERKAYGQVVQSAVRRCANEDEGKLSRLVGELLAQDLADAHIGLFRTVVRVSDDALEDLRGELAGYAEAGFVDELATNPNADAIKLAKIAQWAGDMALDIQAHLFVIGVAQGRPAEEPNPIQ